MTEARDLHKARGERYEISASHVDELLGTEGADQSHRERGDTLEISANRVDELLGTMRVEGDEARPTMRMLESDVLRLRLACSPATSGISPGWFAWIWRRLSEKK